MRTCATPLALAAALAMSSCASAPPASTTSAWLERFAAASRFVPAGMQSHWFIDLRDTPVARSVPIAYVQVRCGRAFQAATRIGIGVYEGVAVDDYGDRGVPAGRREGLGVPRPAIAGAPVWEHVVPGQEWEPDIWIAIVADRFVVSASSEALLREALSQRGAPSFGSLAPLPEIPPTTIALVVRDLAGTSAPERALFAANAPGVSAIAAFDAEPFHVRVWGHDEEGLRALTGVCFSSFHEWRVQDAGGTGWHSLVLTRDRAPDETDEQWFGWCGLCVYVWFGAWILV